MKLSIAMTTYNGEKYLVEQLESFLSQTQKPDELVVCDDGSSDNTIKILRRFQEKAPFIVRIYENTENIGCTLNFSRALELCEGDIIFLSDQDDVWFPEKIETIKQIFLASREIMLVINDQEITDSLLSPSGFTKLGQIRSAGFSSDIFGTGCCTTVRSVLKPLLLPFPPQASTHDGWIHTVAQALDSRFIVEQPHQFYRRHNETASNWLFSRAERITPWKILFWGNVANGEAVNGYIKRYELLQVIVKRLESFGIDAYTTLGVAQSYSNTLSNLKREQNALMRRATALKSGWFTRRILFVLMWFRGDYQYFIGWKSFLKDILR